MRIWFGFGMAAVFLGGCTATWTSETVKMVPGEATTAPTTKATANTTPAMPSPALGGTFFVSRDAVKAGDAIEDHYPILMQKPTVEEVTTALLKLEEHIEKANPATIVDSATNAEVTDFSKVNANAKINVGGYPYGVIHSGMLAAAAATGNKRFSDFTAKRLALIGDHYAYFKEQAQTLGVTRSSFRNFLAPNSLDACGAWGAALVRARMAGVGPDLKPVIDTWADYVSHKQFRLSDGTLARERPVPDSIWGDDMYMSIPFLAQMGKMTGDKSYTEDAVKQALQISARLFKKEKGIYAHGWFAGNSADQYEVYWGRVNGWCIMAMCDLLDTLPEDHPKRRELLEILRGHIRALARLQSNKGLWHQLLDKEDSYLETSCTAMFTYGIAHAVNQGWIDPSYGAVAQAGWCGVMSRQNKDGGFDGVCIGTDFAFDNGYYYYRPALDDVHGWGSILLAGSEMVKLLKNDKLEITYGRGGYYQYSAKKGATK